jgi:ABC-type transporter lipoprotein component MlaA
MPRIIKKLALLLFFAASFAQISQAQIPANLTEDSNLSKKKKLIADADEFEIYDDENRVEIYDPFEKTNRKIYTFNNYLDRYFLKHAANFYRLALPKKARHSVRNFLTNFYIDKDTNNHRQTIG